MYREERKQIELLRNKAADLRAKATTQTERDLAHEMEGKALEIEKELPADGGARTVQLGGGARALTAGGDTGGFETLGEMLQAV
jgi:hypothetical protein